MSDGKYEKNVERANPGCAIFLVDQSYSMLEGIAGTTRPKCEVVATAINRFIQETIKMCEKGEDKPRHYFDIGVIGYTTDEKGVPIIGSVLQNALAGRDLVSVVELYDSPIEVETRKRDDGAGGLVDFKFPVWYRPLSKEKMGGTPICGVLQYCQQMAATWCATHPNSFPPVVFHLTDGDSTDGNPEPAAAALRMLSTDDGNLLLFNCHISSSTAEPLFLPAREDQLPDEPSRLLFRMSSALPERLRQVAEAKGLPAPDGVRGMAYNADATKMLLLISVGTITLR